jgi:hypothetical protein
MDSLLEFAKEYILNLKSNKALQYVISHPSAWVGLFLLLCFFINGRHAEKQQDRAWDMPVDNATDRVCRQIHLLETRVWVMSWWIIGGIGVVLIFI